MKNIKKNNYKSILKTIIDMILCISLIVLSIKKGGFYKEDSLLISLIISALGILKLIYIVINSKIESIKNIDTIDILLIVLIISYCLPIVFSNYTNLNEAIFECLRYCTLFIVYFIVKNANSSKMYKNTIIIISTIQSFLGIDGMGNRYFEGILNFFDSGYLDKDYDRLSGSIQYANVTAILIFIGIFLIIEEIIKIIQNIKKQEINIKNKTILQLILFNIVLFINITALILTKSRTVLLIFVVLLIVTLFIHKKQNLFSNLNIILQFVFGVALSAIFSNLVESSNLNLSLIILFLIILNIVFTILFLYLYKRFSKQNINQKINRKKILLLIIFFLVIYVLLALNITTTVTVVRNYNDGNNTISRSIYSLNEGINKIEVKINNLAENTNYDIKVYEVCEDRTSSEVYSINSLSSNSGTFLFEYNLNKDNFTKLEFNFLINSGKFEIEYIKINEREQSINYVLIPSDIIFRLQDALNGSTSINDRINYNIDSIKIITSSLNNFLFGVGGEGFKNLYETVQTLNYYSTEAHNSYLQIFVESGIIGFTSILFIVGFSLKKYKNYNKYLFIAFLGLAIHMIVDLDFSYLITILLFGVILGIKKNSNKDKNDDKKSITYDIYIITITFTMFVTFFILLLSNVSYLINNSIKDSDDNISNIGKLEIVVKLDFSDIEYRKKLNEQYIEYLKDIKSNLEQTDLYSESKEKLEEQALETINLIKENTDKIYKYDRFNKYTLKYVNKIYLKYIDYFIAAYYSNNQDEGSKYYLEFINKNIKWIEDNINLEEKSEDILIKMKN